jgi:flagellar hook protein FlgE
MSSALWIGTTGLAASTKEMDVIGNNLANSNTIGYKCGQVSFSSMLSQSLSGGGGNQQVGQGVGVAAVSTSFAQGSYETTGSATDLAIDGTGFFIVKSPKDDLTYYTRAGSFFLNESGNLVDSSGYEVQGRKFDALGATESTKLETINLTGSKSTPNETTNFDLGLNVDSETDMDGVFTTSQTVYDSQGKKHALATTFTREADTPAIVADPDAVPPVVAEPLKTNWKVIAKIDADTANEITSTAYTVDDGIYSADPITSLQFDPDGKFLFPTNAADQKINIAFKFTDIRWGDEGYITWNINAEDAPEITSYAMDSRINSMKNNGYPAGLLNSLDVGSDGIITGFFTNGQQQKLARVRTASFSSNDGLSKVGSYFTETNSSGTPSIGNPGEGGLGKCQSHSLEISNTDVAKEFIKMIAAQRAYQSSSKIITTTDEMLQELMNIKR